MSEMRKKSLRAPGDYPSLSTLVSLFAIDSWYSENDLCFSINFASSGEWLVSQICA